MVHGFDQFPVVPDADPFGIVHRLIAAVRGRIDAVIHLAANGTAHIKVIACVLGVPAGKCAGAYRLGLQRRKGPVPVHLVGHHALDVILQIHHIDDPQVPAVRPDILKAAVVLISLEPGLRLLSPASLGHHAQRLAAAVVKLVQNLRGSRPGDENGVIRGTHRLAAQIVRRPIGLVF